ncbi:ABC transporter permease [Planobispora longispora]|uniref:Transport permease protein n=1 Tax=Planobispora longispora TaxID=28887 RepID=A0A8J3RRE9_9ACTN|nr:ABC transporter permease [Planobispora longispora]BFE88494.1 ABC transporter permease [Planobispora longispora]GIH79763.1 transport permease protein [Planobispora longispora]
MSVRDLAVVTRFGGRLFWRDRAALSTSVLLFLGLGIGLPFMMDRLRGGSLDLVVGQHVGVLAMVLVISTFNQIVVTITARRDQLLLKRMRTTGLGDGSILGGEVANLVLQSTLLAAVISGVLYATTSLPVPRDPLLFALAVVLGSTVLCLLGVAFTPLVPRAEIAAAMAMPFFMLAGLGGGGFGPLGEMLPDWVGTALGLLPTEAITDLARTAYAPDGTLAGDLRAAAVPALNLAVWTAIALLVIARRFRWEPRRS